MEENTYMLTFELIRADVNSHRSLIQMKWEKNYKTTFNRVTKTELIYRLFDSVEYLCLLMIFLCVLLYDSISSRFTSQSILI